MERALFTLFFSFRSHQWCKKSVQKKRDLRKEKISHLKKGKIMLFENRGAWAPNCKGQYADTRWVMAYSHKTQSFMKNGGQLKCLDKALIRDHAFFISNARLKLAKNQANAKQQQLRLNFCYLKIIHILHPRYHPKIIGHILKKKEKSMLVCIHEIYD